MTIELDHVIVPSRDQVASAKMLAEILGVPWAATSHGLFSPFYVNEGLTLDFIETDEDVPAYHVCFRASQEEFDDILARIDAAGIDYRSMVRGPVDRRVSTQYGNDYWNEPDGHQ